MPLMGQDCWTGSVEMMSHSRQGRQPAGLVAALVLTLLPLEAKAQAESQTMMLEEVTVTARRRAEREQDVPAALTIIRADELGTGRTASLEDAAQASPNTVFNAQSGPLTIRGIGSPGMAAGVDRQPAVGLFIDDVYIARPNGYPLRLEDAERVEIIRGSQATIYGKNTIGGAVNIIGHTPDRTPAAMLEASLGSDRLRRIRASFDAPVPDSALAVHGALSWSRQDGFVHNDGDGRDSGDADGMAARFVLGGDLGPTTRLKLGIDYARDRDDGGLAYAPLALARQHRDQSDLPGDRRLDLGGISARIDHDFDGMTLTSVTGVRGHKLDHTLDGDFTATPMLVQGQTERQRQISQELRLTSTGSGPWRWQGGLHYFHERYEAAQTYDMVTVPRDLWSRNDFDQTSNSYAVFGELGYRLTPEWEIAAGGRYSYETRTTRSVIASPSGTYMFGTPTSVGGDTSFTNLSPEISTSYRFGADHLAYGKINRGFKAGGMSSHIDVNGTPNVYDPELSWSYEIGARTQWLDQRLAINVAAFQIDWQDQQVVVSATPLARVIRNASAATSRGVEVDGSYRLTPDWTLRASYGWLDAHYDSFRDPVAGRDYSGQRLTFAPEHSASAGFRWEHRFGDLLWSAGADYTYRSSYAFLPDNLYQQAPTHMVDARLGVQGDGWGISLWGRNLLDETFLTNYFVMGATEIGVASRGRTVGVTLTAHW